MTAATTTVPPAPTSATTPWAQLYAEHLATLDARLAGALTAVGLDGLVIASGEERLRARDDAAYPFHGEPYFKQWLPLTAHPGSWLRLVPGRRPKLVYLQSEDYWHAPPEDPEGDWVEHFDIERVASAAEASAALGTGLARFGAIGEDVDAERFASANDPALLARLDYTRALKTGYEIACIEEASAIAVRGHLAARAALDSRSSEFELHLAFLEATGQRETQLPYLSIVALNRHAAVLHYQHLERRAPEHLRSFLLDAGADCAGYASDITRTWPGPDGDRYAALIGSLDELQRAICALVRPGVDFVELNATAHERLAVVLAEHGLLSGASPEEALARGVTRAFLPHGLGHLLGLQVHDVGGRQTDPDGRTRPPPAAHPHLRLTRHLAPGFVLTIEPGVYFIQSLLGALKASPAGRIVAWPEVESLVPYGGIRIEDNLLVTADGARNLTRDAWGAAAASD